MFKPVDSAINFIEMEKKWLSHWYEKGTVEKYLTRNKDSKERYSFFDGPITANNPMGVHHGWGRTYKDLWQKFHTLLGHKQRYQNGFDCQGLWVEVEVEKEIGTRSKKDIENIIPGDKKASIAKFVELCKERVYKYSAIQTDQSKRLGYFMDWENSYFTMSSENNYMIWHVLKKCFENGWIYKGHESVPWCPRCETAISQHEMLTEDYKEVVHESVFIQFPLTGKTDEYLLVWTTTPWTIPANIAVAVDAKLDYSCVEIENGNKYWVVKEQVEPLFKKEYKVVKTVKGKELVGLKYSGPFDFLPAVDKVAKENEKTFHTVIATDSLIMPISVTEGTGLVHTAVSAGTEDFQLGKKYGLPMIPVIADNADYLEGFGEFSGKNAKKHPELIIDFLKGHNDGQYLFSTLRYKHRYPACWRCKSELVWKVADEWYIAMDVKSASGLTLRERMVEVAKKIRWIPEFGLDRELDWLKNMHDWLISKKNRYWGLALPIYECKKCGSFEVMGGYDELKERATSGWEQFEGKTPHKPYIDDVKIKCQKCGSEISRIDDVGNPWLDAGIIPFSTLIDPETKKLSYITDRKYFNEWFPANFITESFPGQFKNWFYSLIAMSSILENTNPFETILGYASCVGEDGRPMHKSWGNSIEFNEAADKIGTDVMRWMYARQNPTENLPFGYKKADEVRRQIYLILWNSFKYVVDYANQDNMRSEIGDGRSEVKNILDEWMMSRFSAISVKVKKSLLDFNARSATEEIESFVNDFSTWYIRRSRDRVGTNSDDQVDKQSFYSTSLHLLEQLSIIISPFMPFISEEIYTHLTNSESVFLANWPKVEKSNNDILHDMIIVREIVEAGHRVRKEHNLKVRQPLAEVKVTLPESKKFTSTKREDELFELIKDELNVKKVSVKFEGETIEAEYDTTISPELELEGELRDMLRKIQQERKLKNISITDSISLTVPEKFKPYEDMIKKKVVAKTITYADTLLVE